MSPKPGVERRHNFRRLEDVHPGGGSGMRVAATRAESNRVRQARRRMAVASLALVAVGAAACLLVLGLAGEAGLDPLAYLFFAAVIPLAWLVCLPAVDRLAFALACAPRRPRRRVVRALRRALDRGELELHFQPQVELETGRPTSVEALLRWRHQGELSLPARFLADAESSEIIGPLTNHVLELAFAQAGLWRRSGRELGLAVNLSATALRDFSVVDRIEALLEQHRVAAETITLEVTETAVLHDPELARAVLDALSDLGVSISIDDFGTGYSSLLWLRLFPVDQVKIDRSFIAGSDGDGEAFIAGVISLGHSLQLGVVAEGVEDEQHDASTARARLRYGPGLALR